MGRIWNEFKDWMLAVGNPQEWERQKACRQAVANAEAGIMTPTIRMQLQEWSEKLGGDRANQGVKMVFDPKNEWTDILFWGYEHT